MNVAIVSTAVDRMNCGSYWKFVYPTVNKYCKKHNFDLIHYDSKLDELDRAPNWQKILILQKHIDEYDWLIWLDADILIMNHRIDLKDYIPTRYKMLVYDPFENNSEKNFNTGFFFLKGKNEWSKFYLQEVYDGDHHFSNNPDDGYLDQSSMVEVMNKENLHDDIKIGNTQLHKLWPQSFPFPRDFLLNKDTSGVQIFKKRINSNFYYNTGDFCAHVWNRPMPERSRAYELLYNNVIWN